MARRTRRDDKGGGHGATSLGFPVAWLGTGLRRREVKEYGKGETAYNQMVLGLFRDLLDDAGYQVSTQAYLEKDLDLVVASRPDLIVLDYMWPEDDNGWSYLQMLRMDRRTAAIPIVLCTGAVKEVDALSGHLAEMGVQVVLKPFNIDRLLDVIAATLSPEAAPAAGG